jgi:hypothetical protein
VPYTHLPVIPGSNSLNVPRPGSSANTYNRINVPGRPYTRASGATLFYSFTMKITSFTNFGAVGADTKNDAGAKNATHRKGGFVGGFHGGAASTVTGMASATGFAGPVHVRREIDYTVLGTDGTPGTQTGRWELGILKTGASPATPAELEAGFDLTQSFGIGDTIFVVGQYDFVDAAGGGSNDVARLWINPTPGAPMGAATVTAPATSLNMAGTLAMESFFVHGNTNSPGSLQLDNIRVGLTYGDVTAAIPEPSTFALVGLGLALIGLQRRKR